MPESSAPELVLVDFDDTLVNTAPRFQNARRELFRLMSEAGFTEAETYRVHHDEVDPVMRKTHGLGPRRMEHSFRATYEVLCAGCSRAVDDDVVQRAVLLGRAVAGTPPVLDGALDALARLAQALPTALYTQSGDAEYQLECITNCGILETIRLERIRIVERKTTGQFKRVLTEFGIEDASKVWMIGNSMRSDINPALEAGANAIFVEVADPWEFDVVDPHSDAFHQVRSFSEAVDFLLANQGTTCR